MADYLSDDLPFWSAPFGVKMIEMIRVNRVKNLLDIGCGAGFPLLEIASRLDSNAKAYGIDNSQNMINLTAFKAESRNINNVNLFCAPAELLPDSINSIDLIVSNNGLNNVADIDQCLLELNRVSVPNCKLYASFNTERTMEELYKVFYKVLKDMNMSKIIEKFQNHIYEKRKPIDFLTNKFSEYGFIPQQTVYDKFHFHFANADSLFNHHLIKNAFMPSWLSAAGADIFDELISRTKTELDKIYFEKDIILSVPFIIIQAELKK